MKFSFNNKSLVFVMGASFFTAMGVGLIFSSDSNFGQYACWWGLSLFVVAIILAIELPTKSFVTSNIDDTKQLDVGEAQMTVTFDDGETHQLEIIGESFYGGLTPDSTTAHHWVISARSKVETQLREWNNTGFIKLDNGKYRHVSKIVDVTANVKSHIVNASSQ